MWTSVRNPALGVSRWLLLAFLCGCGVPPSHVAMTSAQIEPRREGTVIRPRPDLVLKIAGVQVIGTLTLATRDQAATGAATGQIEVPDIDVSLEAMPAKTTVSTAVTELDGKFRLDGKTAGSYRVCWNGRIGKGCGPVFSAKAGTHLLGYMFVSAPRGVIYGTVLTGDRRPCWVTDAFFGLDVYTRVSLLDAASQPAQPEIRANMQGEYAFTGVKTSSNYTVHAECEKSSADAGASLGTTPLLVNIQFRNRAPRIGSMAAFDGSLGITRAPAGATIKVDSITRDVDGDPIDYHWRTLDGTAAGGNSPAQSWTLAPRPGLHSMYLVARDNKGGFAYKRFDIQVGATNVGFSGNVIDETTQGAVSGATVSAGGVSVTTNSAGWFSLSVPPMPSPERYVLNVTHPQYALLSRIHDKASAGQTYELIRAQVTNHNPGVDIDITDNGSSGPCGGFGDKQPTATPTFRQAARARLTRRPSRTTGTVVSDQKPCRRRGARITIPAGTLVDRSGNNATNPVTLSFATLNPERRALPGDYRAVDSTNQQVEMLSYGALAADFRDSSGRPLNLRPGSVAEVRSPVSDLQRPTAPPTMPMWAYDRKSGLWVEEGKATLQNTPEGWMYVGKTTHFSEINMDVAGNDPAGATCVRLELGASLSGWSNRVLRAYVSYAGTSVQVKETVLDGAQYHAIYRIPYAPPAPGPNTLRLELRATYNGVQVLLLNNIINTDARPKMTGNNLWPPYPYTECGVPILLEADPVNLPPYGDADGFGRPAFLTGPSGAFNPPTGEQDATDYYETIDPGNATNPTLESWWLNHGFDAAGGGADATAQYLNFNDLGFGRDMNCKKTGNDLACYVTNYGLPDQNPANADAAAAKDVAKRGATVAMEYIATQPADRRVRFYVYAGGPAATAGKLKFADLDGLGPKPVPHLCHVCHGGRYDSVQKHGLDARFREFDLPTFKYSANRSWDFAGPNNNTLNNTELTNFTTLNKLVHDIAPAGTPIKNLIDAWYTTFVGAQKPVLPTPPAGWSTEVAKYHTVYALTCRTCHVARDAPFDFTFSTSADLATTAYAVCSTPKVMPNAFVTYKNFWSDIPRVIDYEALTGADCGVP